MKPIELKSEKQLYLYVKNFLSQKPNAVQLDGSSDPKPNSKVYVVFEYSVDGKKYKLLGDLTRKAMKAFIALSDEQGSPALALKEHRTAGGGPHTLILANTRQPQGWQCAPYLPRKRDAYRASA
jgi:hypothetical protein